MTSITLPIWVFGLAVGVPMISLLWLIIAMMRQVRKLKGRLDPDAFVEAASARASAQNSFHNDLLAQQIDTVFNGLNAIIEGERLKVRSLLVDGPGLSGGALNGAEVPSSIEKWTDSRDMHNPKPPLNPATGDTCIHRDATADDPGLSRTEVELAMKMQALQRESQPRKLEAVA